MARNVRVWVTFGLAAGLAVYAGCESSDTGGGASMDELASQVSAQRAAEQQQAEADRTAEEAKQAAAALGQAPAEPQRTVAGRAGVGQGGGYYTAIIGARRHVLNRVEDLAWTQGVQHFQATNGRLPKDHAEFMSQIVEPLEINLGYKEEDQEFLYDPTQGQWGEVYVVEKLDEQPAQ